MAYPNRTLCSVLDEMRECFKTRNFASILGLVQEAQTMGNQMEAALEDKDDVERWSKDRTELYREIKELEAKKQELEK